MKKTDKRQMKMDTSKSDVEENTQERPKKKKKEYEGSRWASFFLLIIVLLAGLWFYVVAGKNYSNPLINFDNWFSGGMSSTYTFD